MSFLIIVRAKETADNQIAIVGGCGNAHLSLSNGIISIFQSAVLPENRGPVSLVVYPRLNEILGNGVVFTGCPFSLVTLAIGCMSSKPFNGQRFVKLLMVFS